MNYKPQYRNDLQAVVYAGETHQDINGLNRQQLKAFLKVMGLPLIFYPIMYADGLGFGQVIIIIPEIFETELRNVIEQYKQDAFTEYMIEIIIVPIDHQLDSYSCLKEIKPFIKKDFYLFPCDLVSSKVLFQLEALHRTNNSLCTIALLRDPSAKKPDNASCIYSYGITATNRLVDFAIIYQRDSVKNVSNLDSLCIPKGILKPFGNITIHTRLSDPNVYLFSKDIFDKLDKVQKQNEMQYRSLKKQFFPDLIRHQFLPFNYEKKSVSIDLTDNYGCYVFICEDALMERFNTVDHIKYIYPKLLSASFPCHVPLNISRQDDYYVGPKDKSKTVMDKSFVSSKVKFVNNTGIVIKNSYIEPNCMIEENCNIFNSIILEGAHIEKNVRLESCIIGCGVVIGCNNKIKNQNISGNILPL